MKKFKNIGKNAVASVLALMLFLSLHSINIAASAADTASSAPVPATAGTKTNKSTKAEVDYSNLNDGYFMVKWLDKSVENVIVLVIGPSKLQYQYKISNDGEWNVITLTEGNAEYQVRVGERLAKSLATTNTVKLTLNLKNEITPFLYSNPTVNFNANSKAVAKAAELLKDVSAVLDKVGKVYDFVISNITYDNELAANVASGYVPNVDKVLESKKGICFDYAALMTAMLRSQNVPTRLEIGYVDAGSGDLYHAWLSVYSEETGWVSMISFNGNTWRLMDPTFAATSNQSAVFQRLIGDGKNYRTTYIY